MFIVSPGSLSFRIIHFLLGLLISQIRIESLEMSVARISRRNVARHSIIHAPREVDMHQRSTSRNGRGTLIKHDGFPSSSRPLLRLLFPWSASSSLLKSISTFSNTALSSTGVLFICFNVDYRVLFLPVTDETVADAFQFYTMFYNAPPAIKVRILFSYEVRDQRGLTLGNGPGLFSTSLGPDAWCDGVRCAGPCIQAAKMG